MPDFPCDSYDRWKTTPPDYEDPRDDTTCPHGEDTPNDCPTCTPDEVPGPNGCTCGFNGDCNCPFVETP